MNCKFVKSTALAALFGLAAMSLPANAGTLEELRSANHLISKQYIPCVNSSLGAAVERLKTKVQYPQISKGKSLAEIWGYPDYRISSGTMLKKNVVEVDAAEISRIARQASACVVMDNGHYGTGFFVAKGVVATNAHVLGNGKSGVLMLLGTHKQFRFNRIIAMDRDKDIALIDVAAASDVQPLPLADGTIASGEDVFVFGNPQGLLGAFTKGQVSAYRDRGALSKGPTFLHAMPDGDILEITAQIDHGNSGSSVLNKKGQVVGIVFAFVAKSRYLTWTTPAKYIKQLLASKDNKAC